MPCYDAMLLACQYTPLLACQATATPPYRAARLTRYIGGHSDILAGAVTVKHRELTHEVAKVQKLIGAPLAPLESFLLARGLRTLHVRMERHGENAMVAAKMLETHPLIQTLYYPGLPSHPDHELAKRTFTSGGPNSNSREQSFGGMLAFIVKGDPDTALRRAQRFAERLELVTLAVSLGGTESHPTTSTRTPALAPARTPALAPARTPALAPARTPALAPARTPALAPAFTLALTPAFTLARTPAPTPP
jgi:hypothetical protein